MNTVEHLAAFPPGIGAELKKEEIWGLKFIKLPETGLQMNANVSMGVLPLDRALD